MLDDVGVATEALFSRQFSGEARLQIFESPPVHNPLQAKKAAKIADLRWEQNRNIGVIHTRVELRDVDSAISGKRELAKRYIAECEATIDRSVFVIRQIEERFGGMIKYCLPALARACN